VEETLVPHRMAKLNVFGRQLLVARVEQEGWTPARAAEAQGASRATAYKWLRRYRDEGDDGLLDRSSPPGRTARRACCQQTRSNSSSGPGFAGDMGPTGWRR
jgi:transposase